MTKLNPKQNSRRQAFSIKVRVIKAPLVDNNILREVLAERQRALVL